MTPHRAIDHRKISKNALKVIQRLEEHGYEAYLVGGGVRDLLLGSNPKDFDISTNAKPEQIRETFRNSRIIGRRFRIVHVLFGREVIEVTTYRGNHNHLANTQSSKHAAVSDSGRLLRDNIYGTIEEDAQRRDFTINALYYSPSQNQILDFCGGLEDLEQGRLRLIGDPDIRYREDPVRMLRAIRFRAKLALSLDADVSSPMDELAPLLFDIPPARMFDEVLKLFMHGAGLETYLELQQHGLFGYLFPACQRCIHQDPQVTARFIESMLRNTDQRIAQGKPVTPAFLYGALLWPGTRQQSTALHKQGIPLAPALQQASSAAIEHQLKHTTIPRRFSTIMREIWELQPRLERPPGRNPQALLELNRFRAAYDFLLLREEAGENTGNMGNWWTRYQEADEDERHKLTSELEPDKRTRKPRKRRRRQAGKNASPPA